MEDDDFASAFEDDDSETVAVDIEVKAGETQAPKPEVEPAPKSEPPQPAPEVPLELTDRADGTKAEPGYVPLGALLDTRDKLKAAEARASQLEQERAQQRASQQAPQAMPDMFEDPEGYQQVIAHQIQQATLNTRLDISEEMARGKYDDATVDAARDWVLSQGQANPGFVNQVLSSRNPYEFAVKEHRRVQALDKLSDPADLDQFLAWRAAQQQQAGLSPVIPPQGSPLPPRSLASAPSAGGIGINPEPDDEEAFKDAFR